MSYFFILLNGIEIEMHCIIPNVSTHAKLDANIKTLDLNFFLPLTISTLIIFNSVWLLRHRTRQVKFLSIAFS